MFSNISEKHPLWNRNIYSWTMLRDSMEGEDTIKFKNQMYLPIPGAMLEDANITAPSTQGVAEHPLFHDEFYFPLSNTFNPNYHPIPAYAAYKCRAQFPNLVSYLYRGLLGLASADSPSISIPDELAYLHESASPEGLSISRLFVKVLGEVLLTGRCPTVLDATSDGRIQFVDYRTERLINWKTQNGKLSLAVFEETAPEDAEDEFTHEVSKRYRVARVVDGIYVVSVYDEDGNELESYVPKYRGRSLDHIPLIAIGSHNNTLEPDPAPLGPVASTAIQIYQKSADLSQALFLTANPTLVISGIDETPSVITTGPTSAFVIPNPQGQVYYTKTDTSAFEFTHVYINALYERAVVYGAQLLDSSKKSAETAETARLRQTAASATLRSVVQTVGNAFQLSLRHMALWMGLSEDKIAQIKFSPLTEFGSALTPQEQEQLVASWLAGAISHQTVLTNFRKAGILGEGRTEDDELSQLQSEQNSPSSPINQMAQVAERSTLEAQTTELRQLGETDTGVPNE
jgi:hypothetical protein